MAIQTQDRMFATIAGNVKLHREARGMSQQQLASRAGLSLAKVRKLEDGRHSHRVGTMTKVADVLGIEVQALLA